MNSQADGLMGSIHTSDPPLLRIWVRRCFIFEFGDEVGGRTKRTTVARRLERLSRIFFELGQVDRFRLTSRKWVLERMRGGYIRVLVSE